MPTYQYACTVCEHRFEAVQSFSDASLTECPECGQRLRKLYSSVGVVFKGSGFYRNDSRSSTSSTAPAADASPAKSESSTKSESSGKSESSAKSGSSGSSGSGPSKSPAPAASASSSGTAKAS